MNDDELLSFDYGRLAGNFREPLAEEELGTGLHDDWTRGDAEKALEAFDEIYRAQLIAAHFAERWCESVIHYEGPMPNDPEYLRGFEEALRDIAAHLRKGDLLPGGTLYEYEMGL